jgi:hypothetical protein
VQHIATCAAILNIMLFGSGMPTNALAQTVAPGSNFEFVAMGDMPYTTSEVDRDQPFTRLIAAINAVQPAFSIHVGDIKGGGTRYDDGTFDKIKAYFMTFQQPLVYTPGDNEWTDCHRKSNGPFDPLERLEKIRALFFSAGNEFRATNAGSNAPERCQSLYEDGRKPPLGEKWHAVCDRPCGRQQQ